MRVPHASVFVGATHMPPPHNWLTHAIVASDIPGAFTIADTKQITSIGALTINCMPGPWPAGTNTGKVPAGMAIWTGRCGTGGGGAWYC